MDKMIVEFYKNFLKYNYKATWKEHKGRRIVKFPRNNVIIIDTNNGKILRGSTGDLVLYDYEMVQEAERDMVNQIAMGLRF